MLEHYQNTDKGDQLYYDLLNNLMERRLIEARIAEQMDLAAASHLIIKAEETARQITKRRSPTATEP